MRSPVSFKNHWWFYKIPVFLKITSWRQKIKSDNYFTTIVDSTLVGSKILKKGKCICITIEMSFKGLISVPIYVRSIEKHVRHLVWTFFRKNRFLRKKKVDPPFSLMFSLYMLYKQILTKMGSWGWSKLFSKNFLKFDF